MNLVDRLSGTIDMGSQHCYLRIDENYPKEKEMQESKSGCPDEVLQIAKRRRKISQVAWTRKSKGKRESLLNWMQVQEI